MESRPPEGTQKGDVYSFAVIVHQIVVRQGPFYLGDNYRFTEWGKSPEIPICLARGPARGSIDKEARRRRRTARHIDGMRSSHRESIGNEVYELPQARKDRSQDGTGRE